MAISKASALVLAAAIVGIVCAVICGILLIACQVQQNWIYYYTKNCGSITSPVATTYFATINAEIGLYDTYVTVATDFASASVADQYTVSTVDSATTGYINAAAVKVCRAFATIATLSIFTSIGSSVVSLFLHNLPRKIMQILTITTSGLSTFLITISLIVAGAQFKDGMSIDASFKMCIGANILAGVALGWFVVCVVWSSAEVQNTKLVNNETEMKHRTDR